MTSMAVIASTILEILHGVTLQRDVTNAIRNIDSFQIGGQTRDNQPMTCKSISFQSRQVVGLFVHVALLLSPHVQFSILPNILNFASQYIKNSKLEKKQIAVKEGLCQILLLN